MKLFRLLFRAVAEETPVGGFSRAVAEFFADFRTVFPAQALDFLEALGMGHKEVHGFRWLGWPTGRQCGNHKQRQESAHRFACGSGVVGGAEAIRRINGGHSFDEPGQHFRRPHVTV